MRQMQVHVEAVLTERNVIGERKVGMTAAPKPRPLMNVMDSFVARAIIAFRARVEVLSALDALVYEGDDWPQPHPSLGMKRLPWEDWPTRESLTALRDRLRATPTDPHYMLPGSHERANGPECRCGWGWDRFNDRCLSGQTSPTDDSVT